MTTTMQNSELQFFSPKATHNPLRFYLPVDEALSVGRDRRFLMGGVGLAAAVDVLERATSRPLVWATAQYLSFAQPGSVVDLDVRAPVVGNHVTQARVVSHVGEKEIITVNAATGERAGQPQAQFVSAPAVPKPLDCDVLPPHDEVPGGLNARFERRQIPYPEGSSEGRTRMWVRSLAGDAVTSGLLAIVADYFLGTLSQCLGRETHNSSLDNTLRVHLLEDSEWLLCESRVTGMANGFCYGEMHILSERGTLLATGSQSGIVRFLD